MKGKNDKLFLVDINGKNEGSILIPPDVFISNPSTTSEITKIVREEAFESGVPFYISTVAVSTGLLITWSREYTKALPILTDEEELRGDGLTYVLRKVG